LTVVRAEDFGARPESPQVACLSEVRDSDLVVVLIGSRYGAPQTSGLSATHEEIREAAGKKPILAFIQRGVEFEDGQKKFIAELQDWLAGTLTVEFRDPIDLASQVVTATHRHLLRLAAGKADPEEMADRALELLRSAHRPGPLLCVAVTAGPKQQLVSATRLDSRELEEELFDLG